MWNTCLLSVNDSIHILSGWALWSAAELRGRVNSLSSPLTVWWLPPQQWSSPLFLHRMPWVYCLHFIRCRATNSFFHCRETGAPNLPELQMAPPHIPVLFISAPLFNAQPHKHIPKKSTSAFRPNKKANPYGFQNVMNKDTCPENFSALSPPASQIASSETRLVSFRSGSDLWIIQISYENLYWGL